MEELINITDETNIHSDEESFFNECDNSIKEPSVEEETFFNEEEFTEEVLTEGIFDGTNKIKNDIINYFKDVIDPKYLSINVRKEKSKQDPKYYDISIWIKGTFNEETKDEYYFCRYSVNNKSVFTDILSNNNYTQVSSNIVSQLNPNGDNLPPYTFEYLYRIVCKEDKNSTKNQIANLTQKDFDEYKIKVNNQSDKSNVDTKEPETNSSDKSSEVQTKSSEVQVDSSENKKTVGTLTKEKYGATSHIASDIEETNKTLLNELYKHLDNTFKDNVFCYVKADPNNKDKTTFDATYFIYVPGDKTNIDKLKKCLESFAEKALSGDRVLKYFDLSVRANEQDNSLIIVTFSAFGAQAKVTLKMNSNDLKPDTEKENKEETGKVVMTASYKRSINKQRLEEHRKNKEDYTIKNNRKKTRLEESVDLWFDDITENLKEDISDFEDTYYTICVSTKPGSTIEKFNIPKGKALFEILQYIRNLSGKDKEHVELEWEDEGGDIIVSVYSLEELDHIVDPDQLGEERVIGNDEQAENAIRQALGLRSKLRYIWNRIEKTILNK